MNDNHLTQATMAQYAGVTPSQFSKILNETVGLSLMQLSNIARRLSLREIDIITYPDKYVKHEQSKDDTLEAVLQIKLKKDKKDQVLKLIFGDNNIEILNK